MNDGDKQLMINDYNTLAKYLDQPNLIESIKEIFLTSITLKDWPRQYQKLRYNIVPKFIKSEDAVSLLFFLINVGIPDEMLDVFKNEHIIVLNQLHYMFSNHFSRASSYPDNPIGIDLYSVIFKENNASVVLSLTRNDGNCLDLDVSYDELTKLNNWISGIISQHEESENK